MSVFNPEVMKVIGRAGTALVITRLERKLAQYNLGHNEFTPMPLIPPFVQGSFFKFMTFENLITDRL